MRSSSHLCPYQVMSSDEQHAVVDAFGGMCLQACQLASDADAGALNATPKKLLVSLFILFMPSALPSRALVLPSPLGCLLRIFVIATFDRGQYNR